MYSSTCFGRPHAHRQELNNCSSSLWFYCWSVVAAVLLVVVGPVGPTTTNNTAETCWAVRTSKRQVINLRSCCIWLVVLLKRMMMHGLANFKHSPELVFCTWTINEDETRCFAHCFQSPYIRNTLSAPMCLDKIHFCWYSWKQWFECSDAAIFVSLLTTSSRCWLDSLLPDMPRILP